MYDVICVGSSTIDVFADTESELIKIKTKRGEEDLIAYPVGGKILIKHIWFMTGGGGTNTAVSLARLNNKAAYLGVISHDDNSKKILDELKKEKVDFIGIRTSADISGYSMILDSIEHDRTVLAYKGCNDNLRFSDINLKKLNTRWFYMSAMLGESFKTIEKLALFAEKKGIKTAFNPSSYLAEKGAVYLHAILERTHLLVLNREEAEFLVGRNSNMDLLLKLHELGPKIVVVTNGKKEVFAFDGTYMYSLQPRKTAVREATGAGDAFASTFLAGLIKRKDIVFALKLAQVNAESVLMHRGAKNRLLTWNEAVKMVKEEKINVSKKIIRR